MHGQTHGGKGSAQRTTNQAQFEDNWDKIFGKQTTPNYIYTCNSCKADLMEADVYYVKEVDSYDIGDQTVWEESHYPHCELCGSDNLEDYAAVCK